MQGCSFWSTTPAPSIVVDSLVSLNKVERTLQTDLTSDVFIQFATFPKQPDYFDLATETTFKVSGVSQTIKHTRGSSETVKVVVCGKKTQGGATFQCGEVPVVLNSATLIHNVTASDKVVHFTEVTLTKPQGSDNTLKFRIRPVASLPAGALRCFNIKESTDQTCIEEPASGTAVPVTLDIYKKGYLVKTEILPDIRREVSGARTALTGAETIVLAGTMIPVKRVVTYTLTGDKPEGVLIAMTDLRMKFAAQDSDAVLNEVCYRFPNADAAADKCSFAPKTGESFAQLTLKASKSGSKDVQFEKKHTLAANDQTKTDVETIYIATVPTAMSLRSY